MDRLRVGDLRWEVVHGDGRRLQKTRDRRGGRPGLDAHAAASDSVAKYTESGRPLAMGLVRSPTVPKPLTERTALSILTN